MSRSQKTGFHYLGMGCLIAGVVLVLGGAVLGFGFFRWAQNVKKQIEDPRSREEKVLEVLGAERLPDGYHAMLGVSVPMLMEMAMLTDRPADEEGEVPDLGSRGLIYMAMRNFGDDRDQLQAFFDGTTDSPEALRKSNIDVDLDERVASGRIGRDSGPILWVTHRGELGSDRAHGRHSGLVTLLSIDCPDDDRNRVGIWFAPEPDEAEPRPDDPLAGSIADPDRISGFVDHFRFCPD